VQVAVYSRIGPALGNMRRLLQRRSDGYYYSGPGQWVNDEQAAWNFSRASDAINCAIKEEHRPIRLVLRLDESNIGFSLSLTLPEKQTCASG
jgi:hypothetical protein